MFREQLEQQRTRAVELSKALEQVRSEREDERKRLSHQISTNGSRPCRSASNSMGDESDLSPSQLLIFSFSRARWSHLYQKP